MFDIDFLTGFIVFFYVKMPISDFILYLGALFGVYKNYKLNMRFLEQQLKQMNLSAEEKAEAMKWARMEYIVNTAKDKFHAVEKLAETSENKIDDKLVIYIKSFTQGMIGMFGEKPTDAEVQLMKDRALALAREDKMRKQAMGLAEESPAPEIPEEIKK